MDMCSGGKLTVFCKLDILQKSFFTYARTLFHGAYSEIVIIRIIKTDKKTINQLGMIEFADACH